MKLTGKIEGQPVTFTLIRQEGRTSVFQAEVPATLDGEYVVELTATDDAGNVAFVCKYIVTIDMSGLCVHIVPLPDYWLEPVGIDYDLVPVCDVYRLDPVQDDYDIIAMTDEFWLEPIYPDCKLDLGYRI